MEDLMLALIWLGFFASVFLGWYYFLQARNKERMALIERDKDVSEIYAKREVGFRFPWLKLGMLITGIGVGLSLAMVPLDKPHVGQLEQKNRWSIHLCLCPAFWRSRHGHRSLY